MRRVCAWCGKDLDTVKPAQEVSREPITHGVCKACLAHIFAQMGVPLSEYLDELDIPIVIVDGEGTVQTANKQARTMLQKPLPEIEGFKGGDVFECAYARLPGGCGSTVHCSGCSIRQTVMNTFCTGESALHTPAYLRRETEDDVQQIRLLISTERVADYVLLRIDAVGDQVL